MIAGLKKSRNSGGVEVIQVPNPATSEKLTALGGEIWGDFSTVIFRVGSIDEIKALVERLSNLGVDCRTIANMVEDNHPLVAKAIS